MMVAILCVLVLVAFLLIAVCGYLQNIEAELKKANKRQEDLFIGSMGDSH